MVLAKENQLGDSQGHNVVPQYVDSKQLFPVKFTYVWCNRKVCVCFFFPRFLIKSQCVNAKHRFLQVTPPISGRNKDMIWAVFQTPVGWWLIRGLYWPTSRFFFNPWAENPDEPIISYWLPQAGDELDEASLIASCSGAQERNCGLYGHWSSKNSWSEPITNQKGDVTSLTSEELDLTKQNGRIQSIQSQDRRKNFGHLSRERSLGLNLQTIIGCEVQNGWDHWNLTNWPLEAYLPGLVNVPWLGAIGHHQK